MIRLDCWYKTDFKQPKTGIVSFQIWFSSNLMISIFVHGVNPEETGSANRSNIQISKPVSCHGAKRKETQHHNYQNIVQVSRMCQWMRTDGSLLPNWRCRLLLFACDENTLLLHWTYFLVKDCNLTGACLIIPFNTICCNFTFRMRSD